MKTTPHKQTPTELETTIRDARAELSRRALGLDTDPFKAIKGQEHCKRALIVAAVQSHTVGIYGPHGSGKSMLVAAGHALGVPVLESTPCPCGNYTDPRLPCKCDSDDIDEHWKGTVGVAVRKCDMHVECPAVPSRELLSNQHGTTTTQAREQVARAGSLPSKTKRGPGCDRILKQVISELGLSAGTLDICLSVAQSIAALAERDTIQAGDIMEAVHYRPLDRLGGVA